MRPLTLIREALATAWATKVPSTLICLLLATMCAATLATVGRTAAAEAQIAERLDAAGARVLVINDTRRGELMPPALIEQTRGLSSVERAVGVTLPVDVVNTTIGPGGTRVPAWTITGDLTDVATLTAGRWPGPGEALVSTTAQDTLGMDHPAGAVTHATGTLDLTHSIVGAFTPRDPFTDYDAGLIIAAEPGTISDSLHVISTTAAQTGPTQRTVLALLAPPSPDAITLRSPVGLAELQAEVTGDFGEFGTTLLLGVLGGGALLIAIVVLADVLVRRTDLGRRRALGATRTTIITLVLTRTLAPAALGATIGVAVGLALTDHWATTPPATFTTATITLALLATTASTLPPALYAATRDPVRVLRTA